MFLIKLCAILVICSMSVLLFAKRESELTVIITSAIYIIVMIFICDRLEQLFVKMQDMIVYFSVFEPQIFLKLGGVSLISAISSQLCNSAGQKGIADSIDLIASVEIMLIVTPTVIAAVKELLNFLV